MSSNIKAAKVARRLASEYGANEQALFAKASSLLNEGHDRMMTEAILAVELEEETTDDEV